MDESPNNGALYVSWLVDNSTGDDIGVGQLVDNELAVTQQITNSSLHNLIEVKEELPMLLRLQEINQQWLPVLSSRINYEAVIATVTC
jgi:hypothetical protein